MWLRFRRKSLILYVAACSVALTVICTFRAISGSTDDDQGLSASSSGLSNAKKWQRNRDIHVVIGFYQGNNLPWVNNENLTDDLLNANMYSPDPLAGRDGEALLLPSFESPKQTKLFQINRFNIMASDRIPLNRSLPDVRRKDCQAKTYPVTSLPTTSIIIVFHNEAWSTLLRTVHSVINRSPTNLISDIILVDDHSSRAFLGPPLDDYVAKIHPTIPVKVVRAKSRVGLIKARLLGAEVAQGNVLTFLDAHCECTKGWLEPLLSRIATNPKSIVSPVIDIINDDTFQYIRSFELHQGGFNWELHFRWFSLPSDVIAQRQNDPTQPFRTAVMAGGLFSIDKKFFYDLGAYDEQMQVWGGENLEISFRGWMCGATLEIVPCSHVGHLFRKSSPYSFPGGVGDVLNSNLARVALVWMDEWKEFYFKLHPEVAALAPNQSVTSRVSLRRSLNCKSFSWYLKTIWPTHFLPSEDRFIGKIRSTKSRKCLQSPMTKNFGQPYGLATVTECILELYSPQLFILTPEGYIKTDDSVCLDAPEFKDDESEVRIMACNTLQRQQWTRQQDSIVHKLSGKCLDLPTQTTRGGLSLRSCDSYSQSQRWDLEPIHWRNHTKSIETGEKL